MCRRISNMCGGEGRMVADGWIDRWRTERGDVCLGGGGKEGESTCNIAPPIRGAAPCSYGARAAATPYLGCNKAHVFPLRAIFCALHTPQLPHGADNLVRVAVDARPAAVDEDLRRVFHLDPHCGVVQALRADEIQILRGSVLVVTHAHPHTYTHTKLWGGGNKLVVLRTAAVLRGSGTF